MTIYSFYEREEAREVKEDLRDHITLALEKAREVERGRIARLEPGDPSRLRRMLYFSILAHDLGKVFYQIPRTNKKEGKTYMSFPGHEVISAYLVDKSFIRKAERGDTSELEWHLPTAFAVLYHHHAMSRRGWERSYRSQRMLSRGLSLLDELAELVEEVGSGYVGGGLLDALVDAIRSMKGYGEVQGFVREVNIHVHDLRRRIWRKFAYGSGDAATRRRSLALLSGLITADYLASNELRGDGTRFLGVLREFHRIYMEPPGRLWAQRPLRDDECH